jgi:hypothetical protein
LLSALFFGLSLLSSSGLDKSSFFHPRYYHSTEKGPELKKMSAFLVIAQLLAFASPLYKTLAKHL